MSESEQTQSQNAQSPNHSPFMNEIIHFRATIDGFDDGEFTLFCSKLYDKYNKKELIIKSLFHLLLDDSKRNKYEHVSTVSKITKSIIDLRDKKASNHDRSSCTTVNKLPSELISYTACYLSLSEQLTSLIFCNRYIYSSVTKTETVLPMQILTMRSWFEKYKSNHGDRFEQYQIDKLNKFRMVKELYISVYFVKELSILPLWNQLRLNKLCIYTAIYNDGWAFSRNSSSHDSELNKISELLGNDTVKQLELDGISYPKTINSMLKNKKIECLILDGPVRYDNDSSSINPSEFKELKALVLKVYTSSDGRMALSLIDIFSDQLVSLHINTSYGFRDNDSFTFGQLKELCIRDTAIAGNVLTIIQSAPHLRRVNLRKFKEGTEDNVIKRIMQIIVCERGDMEYVCFNDCEFRLFGILNEVYNANICTRYNRSMKLILNFCGGGDSHAQKFVQDNLLSFLKALNKSVGNDFLFIFKCYVEDIECVLDKAKEIFSVKCDSYSNKELKYFVHSKIRICNKNNKMCGYRGKWKYSCKQCEKWTYF